jgi:hypothetical protein
MTDTEVKQEEATVKREEVAYSTGLDDGKKLRAMTRYRITLLLLWLFFVLSLVILGVESYRIIQGIAEGFSQLSTAIVTVYISAISTVLGGYFETRRQEDMKEKV